MAEKILVPLKRYDRVEEVIPYIEKVTQPGASVVFLIHHPTNNHKWLQAYCGIMESGLEKTLAIRRMVESYSMKMRSQLARQKVFNTCAALHKLGVKVAVEIYTGSLRKTLKSHVLGGDVDLIVMRPGIGNRFMNFLQGVISVRNLIRRTAFVPVFVLNPKQHI
ncbi:MAG: hypothetical protein ACM3TN_18565 [Alphaproteobacteria bacterium]